MRKNMCRPFDLSPAIVAVLLLLLAPGFTANAARAETGGGKSDYELDVEGMIAVRFYDSVREITRGVLESLERVEKNISDADRYIPNADRYKSGYSNWRSMRIESRAGGALRVPNFYEKKTIEEFRSVHGNLMSSLTELAALNDSLVEYFKGEGAKAEGFKKYTDAKPGLGEFVSKTRDMANWLDSLALKIATAGEARTLAKNPCGVFITNMREVLVVAESALPFVSDPALKPRDSRGDRPPETDAEKSVRMALVTRTAEKLDTITARLKELAAAHKQTGTDAIAYENKSAVETSLRALGRFYDDDIPALVENIEKISAELREKGAIGDYSRVESRVRNLNYYHDEFVGMFNIWAGGTRAMKRARD
ncbi:hypothetical protein M2103_002367 [Ereboglobus sp. PH5-5]|uniref:hypothetical protein n=1 Tax=Ereboglobus sp. PH5-5 TaxID=2940529 RepID=UPI002405D48A|nr:hypothetical protein [Ereboglobus sp. PH5-5]MDF9834130.1 hypothetical protein [Ereboglobus sp. PH5-5]